MGISITKWNYLWQSALLTLLMSGAGAVAFWHLFPQHYFGGYPLIPLFFFVVGLFSINMTEMCRRSAPQRLLQIHLLVRVIRMLFSVIVMALYCVVVGKDMKAFLLAFIVNYLIYLTYDSWFFFAFEVNRNQKKIKNKNNETNA